MVNFTNLHVHSTFSQPISTAKVDVLVRRAKELRYSSLALTDYCNLQGAYAFASACEQEGLKPIIGLELTLRWDGFAGIRPHVVLLAENEDGYRNLIALASGGTEKGWPIADKKALAEHSAGIIALSSDFPYGLTDLRIPGTKEVCLAALKELAAVFRENHFYVELIHRSKTTRQEQNKKLAEIAKRLGLPCVCASVVNHVNKQDAQAQGETHHLGSKQGTVSADDAALAAEDEYLRSPQEIHEAFSMYQEGMSNTSVISDICNLKLKTRKPSFPSFPIPDSYSTAGAYLRELAFTGLTKRFGALSEPVRSRAEQELEVIVAKGQEHQFLFFWDFLHRLRSMGIRTAAGSSLCCASIVAYALEISDINPLQYNLVVERFMNIQRYDTSYFYIDIPSRMHRQALAELLGHQSDTHIAQVLEPSSTTAWKAAQRNNSAEYYPIWNDKNSTRSQHVSASHSIKGNCRTRQPVQASVAGKPEVPVDGTKELDTAVHLNAISENVLAFSGQDFSEIVPICRNSMTGFPVLRCDEGYESSIGGREHFLNKSKLLSFIESALMELQERRIAPDLGRIRLDDQKTFRYLASKQSRVLVEKDAAYPPGFFQLLRVAKPRSILDIAALYALYRPVSIDDIPDYIDRMHGHIAPAFPTHGLEAILSETYGKIVYQEQVIMTLDTVSGCGLCEADVIRRIIGRKRADDIDREHDRFIDRSVVRGYSREEAVAVFSAIAIVNSFAYLRAAALSRSLILYRAAYLQANYRLTMK